MSGPVMVTGGSGMLGRAVLALLDRDASADVVLAPTHEQLDLTDTSAVVDWFGAHQPRAVVHLAGHVRGLAANMDDQVTGLLENGRMAMNVAEACARTRPERVVVAGSTAAYGFPYRALPLREKDLMDGDVHPGEYGYAWGQRTLIAAATVLRRDLGMEASVAVLTNMFGPGDRFDGPAAHVIPALIARFVAAVEQGASEVVVWGRPETTRDFIYVDDAAAVVVNLLRSDDPPLLVNVATGAERQMGDVAEQIARATRFTGQIRWDDTRPMGIPRRHVDTTTMRVVATTEAVGFRKGIERTIAWYRDSSTAR